MVKPVVFIGFSLTDPELMNLIRSIQGYTQSEVPLHFVILPLRDDQDEGAIAGWLNGKYAIDPVFYRLTDDHAQLFRVLQALSEFSKLDPSSPEAKDWTNQVKKSKKSKKSEFNPDDPQKGQWGGEPERNGRTLKGEVHPTEDPDWFNVRVTVTSNNPDKPLAGIVTFHLHPTFTPNKVDVTVENGKAEYEVLSYGAFTVGAEADEETTKL